MKNMLIVIAIVGSVSASAQLELGIKGGLNFPTLQLNGDSRISDITTANGSGYHLGAMLRIDLVFFYVQPEAVYTSTTSDYSFSVDGTDQRGTYTMQRLDVPIPVGFKLGPAAIFAGPVASFHLSSPDDIFNNSYKEATWGYQLGAGVRLGGFLAEVRYEGPFSDYARGAEVAGEYVDLDARQNLWIISVGFFF
jgi:hypothetical protein